MGPLLHRRRQRILVLTLTALAFMAGLRSAAAQVVTDPHTLEFAPSPDHNTILSSGLPAVQYYSVGFYQQGATSPFQTNAIGKPAPGTNGLITVDLATAVPNWPLAAGSIDEARVIAVGPGGTGQSGASNPFTFSAGACTYSLPTTAVSVGAGAGTGSFAVNTTTGCAWLTVSNASWITVTLGSTMTGTGFVNFSVTANPSSSQRSGTLTVAGQTVTVTQAGTSCSYSLSTSAVTLGSGASTGSVGVTSGSGCSWGATSNAAWLTITSGSSGSGNGTVAFSVTTNTSTSSRSASVTIAGQTVSVTQAGTSCGYSLSTSAVTLGSGASSGSVGVTSGSSCSWSATSNAAWLTITSGSSGTGNGTVAFSATANTSTSSRSASVTIAGQTVSVTQAAGSSGTTASYAPTFSTYLGGTSDDADQGVFVDGSGNAYIVGGYNGSGFPATLNTCSLDDSILGKFSPTGGLIWSRCIGGSAAKDYIHSAIIDGQGNVFVSGVTFSTNFPTTAGAYQSALRGIKDVFIMKLSSTGAVVWSTLLGGSGDDHDRSVLALDAAGNVYVGGATRSTDFPVTPGAFQTVNKGGNDAYIAKLSPDGRTLLASTYFGGSGDDDLMSGIRIHTDGTIYVAGFTASPDMPTTSGAYQRTYGGRTSTTMPGDGFVVRFNSTLTGLVFATYIGGSGNDVISENHGAVFDATGRTIFAGWTNSTNLPTTSTAYQRTNRGGVDEFVGILSANGQSLVALTYIGGPGDDGNSGIAVDSAGNVAVTGETTASNFPLAHAIKSTPEAKDATFSVLSPDLSTLLFSTYYGGSGDDRGRGVAAAGQRFVMSGDSYSTNYPVTSGAYQTAARGQRDLVLTSFGASTTPPPTCTLTVTPASLSFPASGATASVAIASSATTCAWSAPASSWVSITPTSGVGSGTVGVTAAPNTSTSARTLAVVIAGQTVSVTQAGSSCAYTLSTSTVSIPAGASSGVIGVTTTSSCTWSAMSGASWLTVTGGSGGTGSGSVAFAATANPSTTARSTTLTIAGRVVTVTQAGAACSYTLSTSALAVGATAGTASVTVSAPAGCTWTASGSNTWVSITAGTAGTGNGTVSVAVTANSTTSTRTATLTIAGQPVTITQAAGSCSYTLSTSALAVGATAGTASVTVSAPAGCTWTASGSNTWVSITAGTAGTGNGTVSVAVTANSTTSTRTATLTIAGKPVTVTQAAASCSYTLSTTAIAVGATASTASVNVSTPAGCTWTATSGAAWVSITNGSTGTGNGTVTVSVTANSTMSARTATLTIAGKPVTVTQSAASCSYTLSTTVLPVGATATTTSVTVNAQAGCAWTATSNAAWITVTGGSSVTGAGTVTISVSANSSASSRTGTLSVGGQTVTVNQAGASCSYTLSTTSLSMGAGGGSASIGITSVSGCSWSAVSSAAWLTVTGGNSGSGNGTVTVTAAANSSTSSRSGTVAVGGKLVTVTQSGTACTYSLSAASQAFPSTGGIGSVGLTASGTQCTWTAASTAGWLALASSANGTGSGTVAYTVAPNATSSTVTGSMSIAGLTYTVTVAAAASTSPTVVKVRNESQLQAAVQALVSNTTIELAAGTYTLTRTLALDGPLQDVTLRGSTNNPAEVVLVGGGMNNAAGAAPEALVTTGAVQGLTIANLTIRDVYRHAVHLGPGAQAPRLSNLRLLNAGQAFVRADANPTAGGVSDGVVQGTAFERTQVGRDAVTTAIDVRGGANWRIAANVFRNLVAPTGQMGSPAVLLRGGASNTIAEGNTFINCQRGIAYGWSDVDGYDHAGGIIRNNFFYRSSAQPGEAAIMVIDSPGTEVLQNTAFLSGTYPTPIEYRYPDTAGVIIANNLLDGTVWSRDGAMGQDTNNDGTATAAYFVAAAGGDLHLAPGSPAIDRAAPVPDAMTDWDGDSRPMGAAADMGADEVAPLNRPPTVVLEAPTNGATIATPTTLELGAKAADPDGRVVRVDFYANSTLIGSSESGPFAVSWRMPKQSGSIRITAVAIDDAGARTTSAAVTITAAQKGSR